MKIVTFSSTVSPAAVHCPWPRLLFTAVSVYPGQFKSLTSLLASPRTCTKFYRLTSACVYQFAILSVSSFTLL